MYSTKSHAWLATVAALALAFLPATSEAGQSGQPGGGGGGGVTLEYGIYQLDSDGGAFSGSAADVNDAGVVVGSVVDRLDGQLFAAYWDVTVSPKGTVSSQLLLLPQSIGTVATSVNRFGEVVGHNPFVGEGEPGWYWPSKTNDPFPLLPLTGDTHALPRSINDAGMICGVSIYYVSTQEGVIQEEHPVVWRVIRDTNRNPAVVGPIALPSAYGDARDISEGDADGYVTVAGNAWDGQSSSAVTWRIRPQSDGGFWINPQPTILQLAATAQGVNNTGVVCGDSGRPDWIAMLWTAIGPFPLALPRGSASSGANDLNDSGIVVGWLSEQIGFPPGEAAAWANSGAKPVRLSTFLSRTSPFDVLTDAPAINEAGVIVGAGWDGNDGATQAFIALPK